MSVASEINRIKANIADAYDEAEAKGATMPATENSANLADTVASIPSGGAPTLITKQITENGTYAAADDNADGYSDVIVEVGGSIEEKAVNFYDYDGTVLYAYTAEEALALTALPEAPTHEGLIFQGWNWTLSAIINQVTKYGICDIGAYYTTDDGSSRFDIEVPELMEINVQLSCTIVNGTVEIDWGDGTAHDFLENLSNTAGRKTVEHHYQFLADRKCTIRTLFAGNGSYSDIGFDSFIKNYIYRMVYGESITALPQYSAGANLKSVSISPSVTTCNYYMFTNAVSVPCIIIPDTLTRNRWLQNYLAQYAYSLSRVVLPHNWNQIGSSNFEKCYCLSRFNIPDGVTEIQTAAFSECRSLYKITIPSSVTQISYTVFRNCTNLLVFDLSSYTDPNNLPTFVSSNFLEGTPTDQIIYVANQEMLTAFSNAPNISVYASRMVIKT